MRAAPVVPPVGRPALALAVGLALALAVACGEGRSAPDAAPVGQAVAEDPGARQGAHRPLDERLAEAPETIAHHGLRRVRQTFEVAGSPREVEYVESVVADGRGGFAVAIEDVIVPVLSPQEEQVFVALQENRQQFLFESRDFRIRSLALFREEYGMRELGDVEVAGRTCVRLEVKRREGARRTYELAVDPRTGLVLSSEERSLDGRPLSSSAFETFELGTPAQDAPRMFEQPFGRRVIDDGASTSEQIGFPPLQPTLIPEGYRLAETDFLPVTYEDGSVRNWLRFVYEDGVERLYFLHSPEPDALPHDLGLAMGPQVVTIAPAFRDDHVKVAEIGPWKVVDGAVRGQGVVALGKVSEQELLQLVQSALALQD